MCATSLRPVFWKFLAPLTLVALARSVTAAEVDVGNDAECRVIDFFCPELAHYRQQVKKAELGTAEALEPFLERVSIPVQGDNDPAVEPPRDKKQTALLCAALYVVAGDRIEGLAAPVLKILESTEDPRIAMGAELALAATAGPRDLERVRKVLATHESERVRAACVRVLAKIRPPEFESHLIDALSEARSDSFELALAIVLAEFGRPEALDSMLSLLSSSDDLTRRQATERLRSWTGQNFGFNPTGRDRERALGIRRWHEWQSSLDVGTLRPMPRRRPLNVLAVRGSQMVELGPDGKVLHELDGFNSLSEAVGLENGNRLVTDFMGRLLVEYDSQWKELKRSTIPFQPRGGLRLRDGRTLVIGMRRLQFLSAAGNAVGPTIRFPGETNFTGSTHLGAGHFLITCNNTSQIRELNSAGVVVRDLDVENHPRSVQLLKGGRLLVADFRQAAIYSQTGDVLWRYELDGVRSAHRLPSGNILLGHPDGLTMIDLSGDALWKMESPPRRGSGYYAQLEMRALD